MYEKVKNILTAASQSNTAVIAFNCTDYIMARSVVYAAEAVHTPVILMLYPEHAAVYHTTGFGNFAAMVKELAEEVQTPIGLHADHDYSYESVMRSIQAGFGSVMIDGSMHDLDTNISLTRKVIQNAHARDICVEGEIGHVGMAADADHAKTDLFTKPEAAEKFCRETGVDSLAISIGNAHGEYKDTPHLDIRRLEDIHAAVDVPLVLHGGSGIPDEQLLVAFSKGIRKFNLGTEFLSNYYKAVAEFSAKNADNPDPVKILQMPEYVQAKLQPYVEGRLRTLCRF